MSTLNLYLPPSSPLFSYSPDIPDIPGGNFTGTWQGLTSASGSGSAEGGWDNITSGNDAGKGSSKVTSGNSAILLKGLHFTSFTPLWDAPSSYGPLLLQPAQGAPQPWKSDQAFTQPFGPSSILLTVPCSDPAQCTSTPFTFKGANIVTEVIPPSSAAAIQGQGKENGPRSVIADDASGLIRYSGWSAVEKDNAVIPPGAEDYGGTLSMTGSGNASAIVKFRGTAVLIRGVTAPLLGRFTLTIDSNPPISLSSKDDVTTHDVPLFFTSALDGQAIHQLELITVDGGEKGTGAVIDRVEIWGLEGSVGFIDDKGTLVVPPPLAGLPVDTSPNGTVPGGTLPGATDRGSPNAGTIVGILIGILAALILIYYFFRKYGRPALAKQEEKKLNRWDEANMLQNAKNEAVYVTTAAQQRYVYPGLIAQTELKK